MKTKNIIIFALATLLSCPVFAQSSMRDRTENWTQKSPVTTGKPDGTAGQQSSEIPGVPVGETAWALILGLGAVYGMYVFNRKKKQRS